MNTGIFLSCWRNAEMSWLKGVKLCINNLGKIIQVSVIFKFCLEFNLNPIGLYWPKFTFHPIDLTLIYFIHTICRYKCTPLNLIKEQTIQMVIKEQMIQMVIKEQMSWICLVSLAVCSQQFTCLLLHRCKQQTQKIEGFTQCCTYKEHYFFNGNEFWTYISFQVVPLEWMAMSFLCEFMLSSLADSNPIFGLYDHHWLKPTCEGLQDSSSHSLQLQNARAMSIEAPQNICAICRPATRNIIPII